MISGRRPADPRAAAIDFRGRGFSYSASFHPPPSAFQAFEVDGNVKRLLAPRECVHLNGEQQLPWGPADCFQVASSASRRIHSALFCTHSVPYGVEQWTNF